MTLERFNQILWAVLGMMLTLGGIALAIWIIQQNRKDVDQPAIVLSGSNQPGLKQELVFCRPIVSPGTHRHLLPVAVVNPDDPDSKKTIFRSALKERYSYSSSSDCQLSEYGYASRIINVVVRDVQTGKQWLLIDRPAQIEAFNVPTDKCGKGEGEVPCGVLQWHIRDRDTNKDGVIDQQDALIVFISNRKAETLTAITPYEASLVSFVWDRDRNSMLYQLRVDTNSDGKFDNRDGSNIFEYSINSSKPAQPIVEESIRKELLSRLR